MISYYTLVCYQNSIQQIYPENIDKQTFVTHVTFLDRISQEHVFIQKVSSYWVELQTVGV